MPADVIEQLRMLGEVLDAQAAPVRLEDLRRSDGAIRPEAESTDVVHHGSVGDAGQERRWTTRVLVVAAVLGVVVGLAVIARQDRVATGPGTADDVASTVASPDPSSGLTADELAALNIPAGSILRVTKEISGAGRVWVYDTGDGRQMCLAVAFDDDARSAVCADTDETSSGRYWRFVQHAHSQSEPALLVGLTVADIGFSVTINGHVIKPDADGIWYAFVPLDTTEFSITTNRGTSVVSLAHPRDDTDCCRSVGIGPLHSRERLVNHVLEKRADRHGCPARVDAFLKVWHGATQIA